MPARMWDVLALTKPRITLMTLVVAAGAMALSPSVFLWKPVLVSLLGVGLLVSGSSALNMYLERDYDGLMERTKDRPLPSGRLQAFWALAIGLTLLLCAVIVLGCFSNPLTLALGVFSLFSYVLIYTPLKRWTSWSLVIGAIPGAMPALLGYTAVVHEIDWVAAALFGIAFFWQLPHVIAISIFRGDEYKHAGYPVVAEFVGLYWSKWLILLTIAVLVVHSIWLWWLGIGGLLYLSVSIIAGVAFSITAVRGFWLSDACAWARQVFQGSLIYQTCLFTALVLDAWI